MKTDSQKIAELEAHVVSLNEDVTKAALAILNLCEAISENKHRIAENRAALVAVGLIREE